MYGALLYDVGLGLGLLLVDTLLTIFVVTRVLAIQERRKRRTLSALAEARVLELLDGMLADALPADTRDADPPAQEVTVGDSRVVVQVQAVGSADLSRALRDDPQATLRGMSEGIEPRRRVLGQPLYTATIEPELAPALVRLILAMGAVETLAGLGVTRGEEAEPAVGELVEAAWDLRAKILDRWT